MDTSVAAVTVSSVVADTSPRVAVIVVGPAVSDDASPSVPEALLMVATFVSEEDQVTVEVKSCVELSEYIPIATNDKFVPEAMDGFVGSISMESNVAEVTVKFVLPEIKPNVPEMVVEPAVSEEARPTLSIVAIFVSEESQVTDEVKSWVEKSENVPMAENCNVEFDAIDRL